MSGLFRPASDAQVDREGDGLPAAGESQGDSVHFATERPPTPGIYKSVPQNASSAPFKAGQTIPVIINRHSGTAARLGAELASKVEQAFAAVGLTARVAGVEPDEVNRFVAETDAPLVAVGGGDGTLAGAAAILSQRGATLGVLPLGTRNHFARDLGILTLEDAVKAIASGDRRHVDLGCAEERIFINNCSIGLYASLVDERDRHRLPKWLATFPAAWRVLRSGHVQHLRLEYEGAEQRVETPLLFVGNNRYSLDAGSLGHRQSLADGKLSLAAVAPASGVDLAAMALRLVFGVADLQKDFAALAEVSEMTIFGHRRRRVALDGEVTSMSFPLKISIIPGALAVMAPV